MLQIPEHVHLPKVLEGLSKRMFMALKQATTLHAVVFSLHPCIVFILSFYHRGLFSSKVSPGQSEGCGTFPTEGLRTRLRCCEAWGQVFGFSERLNRRRLKKQVLLDKIRQRTYRMMVLPVFFLYFWPP